MGGGLADVDTATNDVWVFQDARSNSGNSWQQLSISGPMPSSRVEPAAAYDQANNRLILFGGDPVPGYCYGDLNDLWVLTNADGTGGSPGWMELSPTGTAPSPRSSTCSIYDPASNRLMVYGGPGTVRRTAVWGLLDFDFRQRFGRTADMDELKACLEPGPGPH